VNQASLNQAAAGEASRLAGLERLLLLMPLASGGAVALAALLLPVRLATMAGYPGNDHYIYRLAGAAGLGYAAGLALALRSNEWPPVRLPVTAVLAYNLASIYACGAEIAGKSATWVVYLILVASLGFVALTGGLLFRHQEAAPGAGPRVARWVVWLLVLATILAATFGLLPLLFPVQFGQFFGLQATDTFIYHQAGAATFGYAVMGVGELMSRRWGEIRWPAVMALTFNGIACVVSLLAIVAAKPSLLTYLVAPASLVVAVGMIVALRRKGS
jgi:hypothetical protein